MNGFSISEIGELVMRDGALFAKPSELRALRFTIPAAVVPGADGLIPLAALPGVSWRIDPLAQIVYITATNAALVSNVLRAGGASSSTHPVESGTGATLDYDVVDTAAGGHNVGSALLGMTIFSPKGVITSGLLTSVNGGVRGPGVNSLIRLSSTYSYSDPAKQRRYYLGDFISGALAWTRPVRLGGAQITSDFSMQPDLITFPLPFISGSAAVPSTLDVLVNGTRLFSQQVNAGPFEIPQLPVVTGAGEIVTTLTNALGKAVTVSLPFYASSLLLAPGLQSWTAQTGALRMNYGARSNDYGRMASSFTFRRGLTPRLTVESSAETTAGVVMAGAGVAINLENFAVLNAAFSASSGTGRGGAQFSGGIQRNGRVVSIALAVAVAGSRYTDIAAVSGASIPLFQLSTTLGLSLGRFGSLGISYASRDISTASTHTLGIESAPAFPSVDLLAPTFRSRVVSVSYSTRIRKMAFSVTAFRDYAARGSFAASAGLTIPIGARTSVSTGAGTGSSGRNSQMQASQSASEIGDMGYQVFSGSGNHQFAQVAYRSPYGFVTGGIDRNAGATSLSFEAQGAVSYVDRGLFASNTIGDAFAIADTDGLAGVHVLSENRLAGVTNAAGKALIPDLRSFDINRVGIVATDIPMDVTIGTTAVEVRPQSHSGIVVNFHTRVSHAAVLTLVDLAGTPLPLGSAATLQSSNIAVSVGIAGETYVEDLQPHNTLVVLLPNGTRCSLTFDYAPITGEVPTIGPLPCRQIVS